MKFKAQLHDYAQWRDEIIQAIEMYREWCDRYGLANTHSSEMLVDMLNALSSECITLAFVAEFSRGKTELINSLFFAEMGLRLLPSAPGRTTMCPTELFYDAGACYMRLLDIETRLEDTPLIEYKKNPAAWTTIELDCDSPEKMQQAYKELLAVKKVPKEHAKKLGLWNEYEASELGLLDQDDVEVPCWRYALISLSHPLLKQGLCILDTPGLNALGVEPELTLNLLPSAEAIIFVLAADRGVTKSDLELWRNYLGKVHGHDKAELAVVMNKIDALWDDLLGETEFDYAIAKQIHKSATSLGFNEQHIVPVSAKQALVANIKSDAGLLEKSRLESLESYLSDNILRHRRKTLKQAIANNMRFLLDESLSLSEAKYKNALDQLAEFKKIDCDNADMMEKLLTETRNRQQAYLLSVEDFQASRRVFGVQAKALVNSLSKTRVDAVIQRSKEELTKSLTTYGMKQNIQLLFDDLRSLLQEVVDTAKETKNLVDVIHKKFSDEYGFNEVELKLFSINHYQFQLEHILEEGELFRSSAKTTMTEQTVVVKKLYSSIISRVRDVFHEANQEASQWSNSVLLPLMHQIKDHKKQIDSRLYMLRKINGSKESIAENIAQLETQLVPLIKQYTELQTIIKAMKIEGYAEH